MGPGDNNADRVFYLIQASLNCENIHKMYTLKLSELLTNNNQRGTIQGVH